MGQQGSQSAYTYIYMCVCTLTLDFHFHNNIHHYCQSSRINRKGHLIPEQSVKKPLIHVQCMYIVAVYGGGGGGGGFAWSTGKDQGARESSPAPRGRVSSQNIIATLFKME